MLFHIVSFAFDLCCTWVAQMDKLQYIQHIKQIPSEEGRAAELALFRRRPEEAEAILLQVRRDELSAGAASRCVVPSPSPLAFLVG